MIFRARLGLWPRAPAAVTVCGTGGPHGSCDVPTGDLTEGSKFAGDIRLVWLWLFQVRFHPGRAVAPKQTRSHGRRISGTGAEDTFVSHANTKPKEILSVGRMTGVCGSRGGPGKKPLFGGVSPLLQPRGGHLSCVWM